jgi:hypothetical protein
MNESFVFLLKQENLIVQSDIINPNSDPAEMKMLRWKHFLFQIFISASSLT